MNVAPAPVFRPSAVGQAAQAVLRAGKTSIPIPGTGSNGENNQLRSAPVVTTVQQDVVKVQLKPPGEIVVYQFVDQHGTVVLQVPPQQMLELAEQISQEVAPKPPEVNEGGKKSWALA